MLCVTNHDRVTLLEFQQQLLDARGRNRIERGARLVHQQHLGLDRQRARDAQALLLAAREADAGPVQTILDLVPQRRLAQALLDNPVALGRLSATPLSLSPAATLSSIDMVGNGVGFWNTIPIRRRTWTGSTPGA